ncbi:hypothetical protein [Chitinophaga arvensicola]|uniref:Uncharacterized protein n=1 Tax=Chitinophaga arvensicola TaxID=29529 RepID=A0A1I0RSR3_9BACT|nr:hypothetical protein [Chitinophaga arvensicola]SEW43867.1 hypothetical protein SAMN04488122_3268 [Chitinophaga arvensicola]
MFKVRIIFLMLPFLAVLSCIRSSERRVKPLVDTVKRPAGFSDKAVLENFGGGESYIPVWMEYSGALEKNGITYPHIRGIKFYYPEIGVFRTCYYENNELRQGQRSFNFNGCRVAPGAWDSNITLINGQDCISMFYVIGDDTSSRENNGFDFTTVPAVALSGNDYLYNGMFEYHLSKEQADNYTLRLYDGTTIAYKMSASCKAAAGPVSFVNRENGNICFLAKDCYLTLVHPEDREKLQE